MPRRSRNAHGAALRLSSIIRLEGTMRVIFPLPSLVVAGAALGGLFASFAVGSVPTDGIGIAAATERQFGADVAICHGSASAGVTPIMLRFAPEAHGAVRIEFLRLTEGALRFAMIERIGEPQPLIEIRLRQFVRGRYPVRYPAEPFPQRRICVGESGRRRGGLHFRLRHLRACLGQA